MNRNILTGLFALIAVVSLAVAILTYSHYSSSRPIVTVGSDVIRRKDYQDQLDYQAGKAVLTKMVYSSLVLQAAAKNNVMPADKDIDDRIADIRRRTPQALTVADQDPAKMADLRRDLKSDIALENLRMQNIPASDSEISAFYQAHKNAFAVPSQVQTTLVVAESAIDADTAKSMLQQGIKPDVIARQPRLHVNGVNGFQVNMNALPPVQRAAIGKAVLSMKPGEIKTATFGKYILIFEAKSTQPASVPDLATVKDKVARLVKLQKAPNAEVELSNLYQATKPKFDIDKYESFFSDIEKFNETQNANAKNTSVAK